MPLKSFPSNKKKVFCVKVKNKWKFKKNNDTCLSAYAINIYGTSVRKLTNYIPVFLGLCKTRNLLKQTTQLVFCKVKYFFKMSVK